MSRPSTSRTSTVALLATSTSLAAALGLGLLTGPSASAASASSVSDVATTATAAAPTITPAARLAAARVAAHRAAVVKAHRIAIKRIKIRAKVVKIAKSRVGFRYVAGAAGPRRFDCSGLALYVWRKAAGRSLPHYSKAQAHATRNVSRKNLKPGDLVFFFKRGAHHVGVYIGHGRMVGAANPSKGVRIDYVFRGWYGQRYSGGGRLFG